MFRIPLVDLRAQMAPLRAEVDHAIARVLESGRFIGGEEVRAFEREFAAFLGEGVGCASCANGTDALYLTLRALGIGPGDEVITVSQTFIATVEVVGQVRARPVLVDIEEETMLMEPAALERAVTPRTRAAIAVHLFGQPCDMDAILDVTRRHDLRLIEDAAQAHGARWKGRRVGTFGDAATFSFFPSKNLSACGDAGSVVSRDPGVVERVRKLANHGRADKYVHDFEGVNSRLDAMQAAILRVKLRRLDEWNAARRRIASRYDAALRGAVRIPVVHPAAQPAWHLYVIRTPKRDAVRARLAEAGIETGVHYPMPLHRQPAFAHLGLAPGSLPVCEKACEESLSLPMYPEAADEDIDEVARVVRETVA